MANIMGFTFDVQNKDLIIQNSSSVILINHQSILDMAVLAVLWPLLGRATVVAKKELMYLFPFSFGIYLWGTIFIDRKSTKDAHQTLDVQSEEIIQKQVE
jgi:lysophosphatidate acyltransferase